MGEKQIQMQNNSLQIKRLNKENEGLKHQIEGLAKRCIESSLRKRVKDKTANIRTEMIGQTIRVFKTLEEDQGAEKKPLQIKISDLLGKQHENKLEDSEYLDDEQQQY